MLGDVLWALGAAFHEALGEGHGRCPTAEICLTKCKVERARKWSGRCSGGRSMRARAIQEGIDTLFDFSETTRLGSLLVQACAPIRGRGRTGLTSGCFIYVRAVQCSSSVATFFARDDRSRALESQRGVGAAGVVVPLPSASSQVAWA